MLQPMEKIALGIQPVVLILGQQVGGGSIAKDTTVHGKSPKPHVNQAFCVYIKMLVHYGWCHISAQYVSSCS